MTAKIKSEEFIKNITEFKNDIYTTLDNDRLVLFAVAFLEENNIEPTFDKVVVTAFKLFPKRFSLIGFPEYPDGKRIHDCLWHCTYKTKGWLLGNAKSGYKVTERGSYFLDGTKKMLEGKIKVTKKYGVIARRKELTFINLLKKTTAYKKYESKKGEDISESEVREALRADFETKKEILKRNLERYTDYANKVDDASVKGFLSFITKKFSTTFGD